MSGDTNSSNTNTGPNPSGSGPVGGISTVQSMNFHHAKIDVMKFDGKINFGMWRCEVIDALLTQGLNDTIELEAKPSGVEENSWILKNRMTCAVIRSCLTQDIKYQVMTETSAKKVWDILESKYLTKSIESRLHLKRRLYRFQLKKGVSIDDHLNDYTKLLADLVNVDVDIEDEDKALILLSSLPDEEYETFVLTLINGKASLKYNEVTGALVSYEMRRKDRVSSGSTSGEALTVRGRSPTKQGGQERSRSKSKSGKSKVAKDQCFKCKKKGHWLKDCPENKKNKKKGKSEQTTEANVVTEGNDTDSSNYSLSITSSINYADSSEWLLDSGATYHVCPKREWFSSFENIDGGVVFMGNDHTCQMVGIGIVRMKMFDGAVRELTEVRYMPALRKNLISLGALESKGFKVTMEDSTYKVTKGSFVIMKGVRDRHLYYLKGSTVTGALAATVGTNVDSTRL